MLERGMEMSLDLFRTLPFLYLKKVVIHTLVEWEHLYTFLPELYAEYKDQPMDAD